MFGQIHGFLIVLVVLCRGSWSCASMFDVSQCHRLTVSSISFHLHLRLRLQLFISLRLLSNHVTTWAPWPHAPMLVSSRHAHCSLLIALLPSSSSSRSENSLEAPCIVPSSKLRAPPRRVDGGLLRPRLMRNASISIVKDSVGHPGPWP